MIISQIRTRLALAPAFALPSVRMPFPPCQPGKLLLLNTHPQHPLLCEALPILTVKWILPSLMAPRLAYFCLHTWPLVTDHRICPPILNCDLL